MAELTNNNPLSTPGQADQAQPQYLTRQEAEKLAQDILNQIRSYVDKGRVRAEKAI